MVTTDSMWCDPPAELALADDVHVWRASLDRSVTELWDLERLLSPEEHARADRFCFDRDRRHFVAAHGLLRQILARYTNITPAQFVFVYGHNGKPSIAETPDSMTLHFNLSHSEGLALYAIARHYEVGIDLERIRAFTDVNDIARRFFVRSEYAALCAEPLRLRRAAFYSYWTCKEAYIKAVGKGLSLPLDQFEVQLLPDRQARLVRVMEGRDAHARWTLQVLDVAPDYAAALVVGGHNWKLRCWSWS